MTATPDNTPFFVLGAARSGTTMLRLMLNRHSRLAIPFESHWLRFIFAEMPLDRALDHDEVARVAEIVVGERNFSTWHLRAEQVRTALAARAPAPLAPLVDCLFRLEIAGTGKPRWGDKTPFYYLCRRPLMTLYPGSKLLHIVRDGRDVVSSLEKLGWHGATFEDRVRYWASRVAMAQEAARELGPARNMIIRYEDLVLQTPAVLRKVCAFLGESFEPGMLDFYKDADRFTHLIDGDIHRKTTRPPRPEDVARWRTTWSPERQRQFEVLAGEALRAFAYPCPQANNPQPQGAQI